MNEYFHKGLSVFCIILLLTIGLKINKDNTRNTTLKSEVFMNWHSILKSHSGSNNILLIRTAESTFCVLAMQVEDMPFIVVFQDLKEAEELYKKLLK